MMNIRIGRIFKQPNVEVCMCTVKHFGYSLNTTTYHLGRQCCSSPSTYPSFFGEVISYTLSKHNINPWWLSNSESACLLLRQNEFESRWSLQVLFCNRELCFNALQYLKIVGSNAQFHGAKRAKLDVKSMMQFSLIQTEQTNGKML